MKRFINIMIIISASISSILILCTLLTSYQFYYCGQIFNNSYIPIQMGVAVTMFFLSIRLWQNEHGDKKIIYSAVSLTISILSLLSISILN